MVSRFYQSNIVRNPVLVTIIGYQPAADKNVCKYNEVNGLDWVPGRKTENVDNMINVTLWADHVLFWRKGS